MRDAAFSSHGVGPAPRWYDPLAITGQPRSRISSRARNESRAEFGPSPSILSLTGRGEESQPGFFPFGCAQGFGCWNRSCPEALWNDTKARNSERNLESGAEWIARGTRNLAESSP